MKTHITLWSKSLCSPARFTTLANAADCMRCNKILDDLIDAMTAVLATAEIPAKHQRAMKKLRRLLDKLGIGIHDEEP